MENRSLKVIMVTGGAGFIGSNFIRFLLHRPEFEGIVVNVDKLTYAGNPANLSDVETEYGGTRYFFEQEDICRCDRMERVLEHYGADTIVNFAAESHVDRSVLGPGDFVRTNINGTFALVEAARRVWAGEGKGGGGFEGKLFHQVSTDEVYGSLGKEGRFTERSPYDPRSPYSASKAAADHLVAAAWNTFGFPATISVCSNNYGPYQFPEKMIPLMLLNILKEQPLPVYGDGGNVRDWIYVEDHAEAIWMVLQKGKTGERYNIGGESELDNLTLVRTLCGKMARRAGKPEDDYHRLIRFVKDRPGHDRRYAIDSEKILRELGWSRRTCFEEGIEKTIDWYSSHRRWIEQVLSGEYRNWVEINYADRYTAAERSVSAESGAGQRG
jgi:dTDP-glucose 4,6-dehydratase